ncbi:jnk1/mapk8-associated membrane protein [Anaeramoeba flamelloides]|uniref:Jnk1/mapk8-associated membrane protein n=1 Tax=Anaeramoeba flamelloides TaxID=1746091 RepID=A0AAV7Y377_9EUKA|nr:jnk1/mapk8-associated membrane protein [Anaeramoeba flamelloides]
MAKFKKFALLQFSILVILLSCCFQINCNNQYKTKEERKEYQSTQDRCPGRYCGRLYENGLVVNSHCGACNSGDQTDGWVCLPCSMIPSSYEWCYLVFVLLFAILLNGSIIVVTSKKKRDVVYLLVSCFFETIIAYILTLISFNPKGSLSVYCCGVSRFSDWFPSFYNPPNFHCMSENVYP